MLDLLSRLSQLAYSGFRFGDDLLPPLAGIRH